MYRHRDYSICSIHFLFFSVFFSSGVCPLALGGSTHLQVHGSAEYGSTNTFYCDFGYALSGNAIQTCQSDGTWSGDLPTCDTCTFQRNFLSPLPPPHSPTYPSSPSLSPLPPLSLSLASPSSLSLTSLFHFLLSLPLPPLPSYLTFTNTNSSLLLYLFLQINIHEFLYYPCVVTGHNHRAYTSTQ